jgi:Domain of unknown function (DUF4249)
MNLNFFVPHVKLIMRTLTVTAFVFFFSLLSLSCSKPFEPEVQYAPKLNVYSVLFANANAVYVRVTPVVQSASDVAQAVHGASVILAGADANDKSVPVISLTDTTALVDGVLSSFYYAPANITPGRTYSISVNQKGYPIASASASVPFAYATVPDQNAYSLLQNPKDASSDIQLKLILSGSTTAEFIQMFVECRGLDSAGNFRVATFDVVPVDSLNPFTEINGVTTLPVNVDISEYKTAFKLARLYGASLARSHFYVDIIVTQVDDNLYRYFITSTRTADPLLMRTDKIIFSNIFAGAGTGIVAGASIDTTRVFLF